MREFCFLLAYQLGDLDFLLQVYVCVCVCACACVHLCVCFNIKA